MAEAAKAKADAKSDETARLLRENAETIGTLRSDVRQAEKLSEQWRARADELTKEITDLRGQLLDALLAAERLRGFQDATEAAKPPRMVPEPVASPEMPRFYPARPDRIRSTSRRTQTLVRPMSTPAMIAPGVLTLPGEAVAQRWSHLRKAELLRRIRAGQMTEAEAIERFDLSEEELASWQARERAYGTRGLQVMRTQSLRVPA